MSNQNYTATISVEQSPKEAFEAIKNLDDIVSLKKQEGKDIYLIGGAKTTASLIEAGLVDELRVIIYPIIVGKGNSLFATSERQRGLELKSVQQLSEGRVNLVYQIR